MLSLKFSAYKGSGKKSNDNWKLTSEGKSFSDEFSL